MGKRTSYPPGTFSWVDLAAIDAPASKVFYSGLFGWEMEDHDAGGGAVYTTCRIDDDAVCGLFDVGRMAVLKDPQGAVLALWQPGTRIGAERVNDVGCLCMNELATSDLDVAGSFYGRLFGWTTESSGDAPDGPR